jgi:phosphatidylglycerol lysyltransferase
VYQATQATIPVLRSAGFNRVFRIGQEAIVDLETFNLSGSGRANLRHTITRFRRGGGTVEWFGRGMDRSTLEAIGPRLADIDRTWRNRAGPQLGFTVGEFHLEDLASIPVAVALGATGRPDAFATFRPTGVDHGFVLELIRRKPDAIPGAVEACVGLAAERLRLDGVAQLSLGLAPLHGLRTSGGPIEERLLRAGGNAVKAWYDIDGLAFFKGKFDPRWEPRYVAAVHRRDSIPVAGALLRLHLGTQGSLADALSAIAGGVRRSIARLIARKRRPSS